MTSEQVLGRLAAIIIAIAAMAALVFGVVALVGFLADPDGFLAGLSLMFALFLLTLAVGGAITASGLWGDARWAWELAVVACLLMLVSGGFAIHDPRGPSDSVLLEAALLVGGVLLIGPLVARWTVRRQRPR